MNHIEKALKLADKYEKEGNKEKANHFLKIAEKYEQFIEGQKNEKF